MEKNLLSDTDYTKGWDNRFGVAVCIGKVSKIECSEKGANARIIMPDRLDHEDNPLISKPVPVLQIASKGKRSFSMPRQSDNVLMVKLPNGTSNYAILGSFYTSKEPPPVTDPRVDYCEWEGGHTEKRDSNDDADVFLTQDFKGGWNATIKKDVNLKTTDGAKTNIESDGHVTIKSATGDVNIQSPSGKVNIEQQNIVLKGTVTIEGNIVHTGDMTTSGHHTDANGLHTGGTRDVQALIARIDALEARVRELEGGS
jgi:phage baseplate assembly protein gpV